MTAQKVSINELWALVKQHSSENGGSLPKIDGDKKTVINGKEIFCYINNEPVLYYTIGKNEKRHKLYINCIELNELDEYDKSSNTPVVIKNTLEQEINKKIQDI